MKSFKSMTLHANKSAMKEADKGILRSGHKNLSYRFLLVTALISITMGGFFIACNSEDTYNDRDSEFGFEIYLSLSKTNFDFARDWENLSESDKNTFRIAKKRMNLTFGKDGIYQTKWTSGSQVNISEELFDCFIDMIALTNEATNLVYPVRQTSPRLKTGNETWENCVIQSLVYVLQSFGVYSGPYAISAIDSWILANNYYSYSSLYGGWECNIPNVLTHYLEGAYIPKSSLSSVSPNGSSQYILVLNTLPTHVVVYTGFDPADSDSEADMYNYYDPQNNISGQCRLEGIANVYKATDYNHY